MVIMMTREQKLEQILNKALLVFPVFKVNSKNEENKNRLSHLQFITLIFISHSSLENKLPMNVISSFLGISKQQTTKLIDSLEEIGLITRSLNPTSRREFLITMTEKGRTELIQIKKNRTKEFINRLSKLSDDEVNKLYEYIISAYELFKKAEY